MNVSYYLHYDMDITLFNTILNTLIGFLNGLVIAFGSKVSTHAAFLGGLVFLLISGQNLM